ncbi:MAG: hypothetical protein HOJ35_09425, partial [Bdellovibrionales bacterium]|nr:hypothetical protein [Bdellovibrionales bacterium]
MIISVVIILVLTSALFFNAGIKPHRVKPFPDSKGGTCYAKVFATVDTCIDDCNNDNNFIRNTENKKYGYIIGRSSVRNSKGASWATIFHHAKKAANACFKNARTVLDTGVVYDFDDPKIFQKTDYCSPKYQQAPNNTEEQKGYKRWTSYSNFQNSNIHGLIAIDYCRSDVKAIKYKLKYRSRSSKIGKSELKENALAVKNMVEDVVNEYGLDVNTDSPLGILCTVATNGQGASGCMTLLNFLEIGQYIDKYLNELSESISGFFDGLYVTEDEGKRKCQNDYTRGDYIIQCGELTRDLRPIPLPQCNTAQEFENAKEDLNEHHHHLKDGQYRFKNIVIKDNRLDCSTGYTGGGTSLLCKGTQQENIYKICAKRFTREELIENHKIRLVEKCIESGNLNCEVRENRHCEERINDKDMITKSKAGHGIDLEDLRHVAERMG